MIKIIPKLYFIENGCEKSPVVFKVAYYEKKESLQLAAAHQDKPNGWPSTYNPDRIARIGSDCGSHRTLDRIGSDWHFRFSCITRLKIHHQLENQCKELFSTELHWEIFCCITSYDHNSKKRFGHVTSPESKMVERDVIISQRRRLRKLWEWARCNSADLLSICEWPLQMSLSIIFIIKKSSHTYLL